MTFGITEEELFAARLYEFLLTTDLKDVFRDGDGGFYGFNIYDEPFGIKQDFKHASFDGSVLKIPEEFQYIDHEYCIQHCEACGDGFYGHLLIPLPSGKYMQCYFDFD